TGPCSLEVKLKLAGQPVTNAARGAEGDLEIVRNISRRHMERSRASGWQASPEGDTIDWLRFIATPSGRAKVQSLVRKGRLDRNWLNAEWVARNGPAHF